MTTTTLYWPVSAQVLALIEASGWRAFPPQMPEQPISRPGASESHARKVAQDWTGQRNLDGLGFVTRFAVLTEVLSRYELKAVREHEEYRIPAEDLPAFNAAIEGRIEIIGAYGVEGEHTDILSQFQ